MHALCMHGDVVHFLSFFLFSLLLPLSPEEDFTHLSMMSMLIYSVRTINGGEKVRHEVATMQFIKAETKILFPLS